MDTTTSTQHWANILKQKLMHGEKRTIELSDEEATKLIDNLESFAKDAVRKAQANEKLKLYCAYGDYAAKICTDLNAGSEKCAQLEPLVNALAEKLTQEEAVILNGRGNFKDIILLDAVNERASELKTNPVTVNLDLAKIYHKGI